MFLEFLRFTTNQEECRLKWLDALRENQRLKQVLNEIQKENMNLDAKLTTARKLLDQEKKKKQRAEEERINLVSNFVSTLGSVLKLLTIFAKQISNMKCLSHYIIIST